MTPSTPNRITRRDALKSLDFASFAAPLAVSNVAAAPGAVVVRGRVFHGVRDASLPEVLRSRAVASRDCTFLKFGSTTDLMARGGLFDRIRLEPASVRLLIRDGVFVGVSIQMEGGHS